MHVNDDTVQYIRRLLSPDKRLTLAASLMQDLAKLDVEFHEKNIRGSRKVLWTFGVVCALQSVCLVFDICQGIRWSYVAAQGGIVAGLISVLATELRYRKRNKLELERAKRFLNEARYILEDVEAGVPPPWPSPTEAAKLQLESQSSSESSSSSSSKSKSSSSSPSSSASISLGCGLQGSAGGTAD